MTRFEMIKNMDKEEMVSFFCDLFHCNDGCPAYESCYLRHNGFIDWLNEEVSK